jgi:hypothetical protein
MSLEEVEKSTRERAAIKKEPCPLCGAKSNCTSRKESGNWFMCPECLASFFVKHPKKKIDGRKLKRLDLQLLAEIVTEFAKHINEYNEAPILAIINGLAVGDEFEFHVDKTSWDKQFVVDFIEKFVPEETIAKETMVKKGYERGEIEFAPENKGREATSYKRWQER